MTDRTVSQLWMETEAVIAEVEGWYLLRFEKRLRVFVSAVDRIRLLRLRVWSVKYYLPISEILDMVYPRLMEKIARKSRKKSAGLGLRIASLTGAEARRLLEDGIKQMYPEAEHKAYWRERVQEEQIAAEETLENDGLSVRKKTKALLESDSVDGFLVAYDADIVKQQRQGAKALRERWRRRKRYRFSPWV